MIGADRQFRIDTYHSSTDRRPSALTLELIDLYTLLEHEKTKCVLENGDEGCRGKKCPEKDGLAWTPGFIGSGTRLAVNVEGLDFAVFDIDHITEQQRDSMCQKIGDVDVEFYLHTTHTHLPPDHNFRLVFPLARTITPEEWKQLWFTIVRKFELPADKATRDPARLSYFPRAFYQRDFINVRQEGTLLDPDELLRENLKFSRAQALARVQMAPTAEPEGVDLEEIRKTLQRYDPKDDATGERKELIRRILDEEALAAKGSRGFSTLRAGSIVGKLVPINTPFEAVFELIRPAISKIVVLEGDDPGESSFEAWENQVRRGYEKSQEDKETETIERNDAIGKLTALTKRKREKVGIAEVMRSMAPPPMALGPPRLVLGPTSVVLAEIPEEMWLSRVSVETYVQQSSQPLGPPPGPPPPPSGPPPEPPAERDDDGDWRLEQMINVVNKQGLSLPKNTFSNVVTVLENHRGWKGTLKYNEITNEPEAHGGPIAVSKRDPEQLIVATRIWMAQNEELDLPKFEIADAVEFVSREHKYDPVRAYLVEKCIPRYDKHTRIGRWLIDYCGVKLVDDNGFDVADYVKLVGEKWLMAAAARALYPGCKADNVLVLEGSQYAGKSTVLDVLGGEWFADTKLDLSDNSTLELTAKSWIIELSELASMKKSETDKQKSFFSARKNHFRLAYARRVKEYARRCVFAGTTNEKEYLLDLTGNRRFWCVWCDLIDIVALKRDRDQLWGEAASRVIAGESCPACFIVGGGQYVVDERCPEHRWWLDQEQTAVTEKVATARLKVEFADTIRSWWLAKDPKTEKGRPRFLRSADILVDVLGMTIDKLDSQMASIGRAMKTLGFQKTRLSTSDGGREWVYEATPPLLTADQWILNPTGAQAASLLAKRKLGPPMPNQPSPGDTQ